MRSQLEIILGGLVLISASARTQMPRNKNAVQIYKHPNKIGKHNNKQKALKKAPNAKYSTSKPMKSKVSTIHRNKSNL